MSADRIVPASNDDLASQGGRVPGPGEPAHPRPTLTHRDERLRPTSAVSSPRDPSPRAARTPPLGGPPSRQRSSPSPPGTARAVPARRPLKSRPLRVAALVVWVALVPVSFSFGNAMTAPGQTSVSVRGVDWLRSIGGAPLVSWIERSWYNHHRPAAGGQPKPGLIPATTPPPAAAPRPAPAPPGPIPPVVAPALSGEGAWHPAGQLVNGQAAVYEAFVRPDGVHTSLVTAVAWMDAHLLAVKMFAGAQEPGGAWTLQSPVPASLRPSLVAAFNSGFRLQDSHGGYYADGRTAGHLVAGAASFVIRSDGTATVGEWGRDVRAGPSVVAVRQNLSLLVDGGRPVPGLAHDSLAKWGATLGNQVLVWRSGIGVTASGALVYAAGPGLSVASLAGVLARAGALRAMELDINTTWVSYFTFDPPAGSPARPDNGTKLLAAMARAPSRYFHPTARDFIAVFAR